MLRSTSYWIAMFALVALAAHAPGAELAGRSVTVELIKPDDHAPVAWTGAPIALAQHGRRIDADTNVFDSLEDNGIYPDMEAFTVVYDLNPTLLDLDAVAPGTEIQVPLLRADPELQTMLKNGYRARLTVDLELREALDRTVLGLRQKVERYVVLPDAQFAPQSGAEKTKARVKMLLAWYQHITQSFVRRTSPPIRRETLVQLCREAQLLDAIVDKAVRSTDRVGPEDQATLAAIYADIELQIRKYDQMLNAKGPKAEPLYEVMVHIKGGDRKLIEKVRVYWTYRGLYQCPPINPPVESYAFKRLGTGNAERLPRANFVVWAARDGEPGRPVTAPLEIKYFQLSEDRSDFDLSLGKWSCRQ